MGVFSKLLYLSFAVTASVNAGEILSVANKDSVIPDTYIVVLKEGVSTQEFNAHKNWVNEIHRTNLTRRDLGFTGELKHSYDFGGHGLKGYSGKFDATAIQEIANDPNVAYVEPDQEVKLDALVTQSNAPSWGLGRISNRQAGIRDYHYDDSAGEGVIVYDVDTGIDISHPDFEGRAIWGSNHVDRVNQDQNGHGTHVAGTIGGRAYGVAKKATIVAVKVLDAQGSGTISGIIAGLDWSVNHARQNGVTRRAALNMSLGGGRSISFNQAAASAVQAGLFVAVAAGNEGQNAGNTSPASEPSVCTVGATSSNDAATSWSNYGSVVDVYAPGDAIVSTWPGGGSRSLSGTSMASPHVAGLGAYLIALEGISGGSVCDRIKELAQPVVQPGPGTTNRLIYNGSGR
ncbi:hypothetical protein VTO42DRAFT_2330 [Malbranchea cinnamomea]